MILNPKELKQAYPKREPPSQPVAQPIKAHEVQSAITRLGNNKAAGPDGIFNEFLKDTCSALLSTWVDLFNKCLHLGEIPEFWIHATLKMLHKGKGDTEDPNAYRGIALENNTYKLLTKIITTRTTEALDMQIPD